MIFKSILLLLNIVAAANGVLLALVLVVQERFGQTQIRLAFAGFIFLVSVLLGIFVALDTGALIYAEWIGIVTDVFALLAGACFLFYVCAVSTKNPHPIIFAPVVFYILSVIITGGRYLAPTDIAPIVAIQIFYTITGVAIYFANRASIPAAIAQRRENRQLPALFAGVGLLHMAQLLRLFFPQNNFLFDLVPFIGAVGLLLIVLYGIFGSQTLASFGQPRRPAGATPSASLESAILNSNAYLDPDLSLPMLASIAQIKPRDLSAYLNQVKGQSFREFVNTQRIDHAMRLLADPDEARTSIEAAALLCGFRSRSSFYEAFKKRTDMTPAEYRKQNLPPG